MRISYWSSEVCSSDLPIEAKLCGTVAIADLDAVATMQLHEREAVFIGGVVADEHRHPITEQRPRHQGFDRSEARRGGQACVSTCSSRLSTDHYKTNGTIPELERTSLDGKYEKI